MRPAGVLALLLLTGCGSLPAPTEPLPAGNVQIRLSALSGAVEGGAAAVGGGIQGTACVLTILGALDPAARVYLAQGSCEFASGGVP